MCESQEIRRRSLTKDDLLRMRLPRRYWDVDCDGVSSEPGTDGVSPLDKLLTYMRQMDDMRARGIGMLMWGSNGTGKSSMAAIIAKEYRRRYNTVLFIEAASIKSLVAGREHFDEDETYWQRAFSVDVLVVDDLGKGVGDSKGFGKNLIDELIRARNGNKLVTIITTNMTLKGQKEALSSVLKESTMHSLKEHIIPVYIEGRDHRDRLKTENASLMAQQ